MYNKIKKTMNPDSLVDSFNISSELDKVPEIDLNKMPSNSSKPIDYVLYYRTKTADPESNERIKELHQEFFQKLDRFLRHEKILNESSMEWEIISYCKKESDERLGCIDHFVLLSFPTDVLMKVAEELHFFFSFCNIEKVRFNEKIYEK